MGSVKRVSIAILRQINPYKKRVYQQLCNVEGGFTSILEVKQ